MVYDYIVARSFSRSEQKKLGCAAFVACFLFVLSFCFGLDNFSTALPIVNLRLSIGVKTLLLGETNIPHQTHRECQILETSTENPTNLLCCHLTERKSDFCDISGDVRVDATSSTVFFITSSSSSLQDTNDSSWSLKPYARKGDKSAMSSVQKWSITTKEAPQCTKNHTVPAVLFSTGAYAQNHYHSFSDIIIPLFLASRRFNGQVQFLVTNHNPKWVSKFERLLKGLSRYEVINMDDKQQQQKQVHCFPSVTVGLEHHRELGIDPSRSPHYSMREFREFLRSSYSLKRDIIAETSLNNKSESESKPRLLIISRKRTRALTNTGAVADVARGVGFEVVVSEAGLDMQEFAETVNSCDAMMGVHGAGMANFVFLPENAVVVQVVPYGSMGWIARTYYEEPLKEMGLMYLGYKIREEESSLVHNYSTDDVVLRDPWKVRERGWVAFKSIYLNQNVELDVGRFKPTLVRALELLHQRR